MRTPILTLVLSLAVCGGAAAQDAAGTFAMTVDGGGKSTLSVISKAARTYDVIRSSADGVEFHVSAKARGGTLTFRIPFQRGARGHLESAFGDQGAADDGRGSYTIDGDAIRGTLTVPGPGGRTKTVAESGRRSTSGLFPFELSQRDLTGRTLDLEALAGKVVLVDYWGTWCMNCIKGMPKLVALKTKLGDDKLEVVGLAREFGGDAESRVKATGKALKVNYPLALIDDEDLEAVPGRVKNFPTLLVLDTKGRVRLRHEGNLDPAELEAIVRGLLAEGQRATTVPAPRGAVPAPRGPDGSPGGEPPAGEVSYQPAT